MRLNISNDKKVLIDLISQYLNHLLVNKRVDLIINGNKETNTITLIDVQDGEEETFIIFKTSENEHKVPLHEETKVRFGKELVVFETKAHSTVIEILE